MNISENKTKQLKLGLVGGLGLTVMGAAMPLTVQADSFNEIVANAVEVAPQYGLYPSVMAAQAILESNGGDSSLATDYNNYFGIKGEGVALPTSEYIDGQWGTYNESFRTYDSAYQSFADNGAVLRNNPAYYEDAYAENAANYREATEALTGVYATDPNYGQKLNAIIEQNGLYYYDNMYQDNSNNTSYYSNEYAGTGYEQNDYYASTSYGDNYQNSGYQGGYYEGISYGQQAYTVQPGDCLWTLAQYWGTTVEDLMAINGLTSSTILVGQTLYF